MPRGGLGLDGMVLYCVWYYGQALSSVTPSMDGCILQGNAWSHDTLLDRSAKVVL